MQKRAMASNAKISVAPYLAVEHRTIATSVFDHLPDSALLRESDLVRSPKRPFATPPLPFSAPTLWRMTKAGTFPKPIRLAPRVTAWKVGDIRAWIAGQAAACEADL